MGIRELATFSGQAIDIGRFELGRPVTAKIAIAQVIDVNNDYIGKRIVLCIRVGN